MNINNRDLIALARKFSVSEKAVGRMVGSIQVELKRTLGQEEFDELIAKGGGLASLDGEVERFNLGFRLGKDNAMESASQKGLEDVERALSEYRTVCPLVFGWLQSGDFDPAKPPARVTRAVLLHASRTAGRLRARLLR